MTGARDDLAAIDDIAARLAATGLFGEIVSGTGPEGHEVAADRTSVIWIARLGWTEQPAANEFTTERTVQFALWLAYRDPDPGLCLRYLHQLENVVLNTLNRQSYAGVTFPTFSLVDRGEDRPDRDGERRIQLFGTFRYQFADDRTDHLTDPPNWVGG
jgi:hypothetical protein